MKHGVIKPGLGINCVRYPWKMCLFVVSPAGVFSWERCLNSLHRARNSLRRKAPKGAVREKKKAWEEVAAWPQESCWAVLFTCLIKINPSDNSQFTRSHYRPNWKIWLWGCVMQTAFMNPHKMNLATKCYLFMAGKYHFHFYMWVSTRVGRSRVKPGADPRLLFQLSTGKEFTNL